MEEDIIDISALDKAQVLAALYNAAKPRGMGYFDNFTKELDIETARKMLTRSKNFDYLNGRVMKVNLDGDKINVRLYNRYNGKKAAQNAIAILLLQ